MILEANRLNKWYLRGKTVFFAARDVSLTVNKGDFICITGQSGSGKSTLLNMLTGLIRPDSGVINLEGRALTSLPDRELSMLRRSRIGYITQGHGILYNLNVIDNIRLPLYLGRQSAAQVGTAYQAAVNDSEPAGNLSDQIAGAIEITAKAKAVADSAGIGHLLFEHPGNLSGGELRRVAIARSLLQNPRILIADEPTGDLDQATAGAVLELFAEINRKGTAVVLVTHDREPIRFATRRFDMAEGKLHEI